MKKILSLITILAILFSTIVTMPVSAQSAAPTNVKVDLKQAIEIAKQKLSINSTGYEFTSNYTENEEGKKFWELSWNSKKDGGSIYVSVDATNGDILNMNQWAPYNGPSSRIPKYSQDAALKVAQDIAKKLSPDKYALTKLSSELDYASPYRMYDSDTYNFSFIRQINGVPSQFNGIYVNVEKNTLKVRYYSLNWDSGPFPNKDKAISKDEAKKIFEKDLGLELSYYLVYPQQNGAPKPILVYTLKNGNRAIDALTGQIVYSDYYGPMYDKEMARVSTGAGNAQNLTPEEQKVIDDTSKYIAKEKAIDIIKNYVKLDASYKLSYANLYAGYRNQNATWNFGWNYSSTTDKTKYAYIGASVDAVTGEIKSFNVNSSDIDNASKDAKPQYDKEAASEKAINFLKKIQPAKFTKLEPRDIMDEVRIKYETPSSYMFNFIRKENGVACPFDYFTVTVNAYTGEITNYSMNWTNISFPAPTGVKNLTEAYKVLYSKADLDLKYIKIYDYTNKFGNNSETKLAYTLGSVPGMIDAKSGQFVDNNGDPILTNKATALTDIKGNPYESDIKLLAEIGVIQTADTKFNPNATILQKDFIKYLIRALDPYYPVTMNNTVNSEYDSYYEQAISRKLISAAEKKPDAVVTRQDAAKMLVRAAGFAYVADMTKLYTLYFKDSKAVNTGYRGYIAIAVEMGLLTADKANNINPAKPLTRGETANILVKYLKIDFSVK